MKPPIAVNIKRIFREQEAQEISLLQHDAAVFKNHYPDHDRWLRKAVTEVLRGDRTAFGAYVIKTLDPPAMQLVGTCILKPPDLSSTVEIKNLYIHPDYRECGCGTMLYREVEQYCGRSGASRLRVELPGSEIATLSWLLGRGFTLSHTRASTYVPADMTYHLEKLLPSYYHGDWFDLEELAKWVVIHLYGFSLIQGSTSESGTIEFEQRQPSPRLSPSVLNFPFMKGRVVVLEAGADPSNLMNYSDTNLLIIFTDDKSSLSRIKRLPPHGLIIDRETLRTLHQSSFRSASCAVWQNDCQPRLGYEPPTFSKAEIAGLIVNMNSGFLDRFYTTVARENRFSYFKTGPVGKYLEPGDSLLIYREPTTNTPTEGIFGFAEIERVVEGKPDVVWKQLSRENPIMLEDEYMRHWGYKRSLLGIVARNFVRIEPVKYSEIRELLKLDINIMNLGHCYVNNQMLTSLQLGDRRSRSDERYDVAISFPSENRQIAKELFQLLRDKGLSVFYDQDAEPRSLGSEAMGLLFDVFNHQSSYAVILCSRGTIKSDWAQYEVNLAIQRDKRQNYKHDPFVIPIRLDDTEVPYLTTKIFADHRKESLRAIADQIHRKIQNRPTRVSD